MKRIKILTGRNKYTNYVGHVFWVFDYKDNYGNYLIYEDKGQPFMFVHESDAFLI